MTKRKKIGIYICIVLITKKKIINVDMNKIEK